MEKQLKLKGFVTPQDCGGSIQAAVDLAASLELNKVVVTGNYTLTEPVVLGSGMYLVLQDACLSGKGTLLCTRQQENFSFREKFITVEGENARICGNVHIFNTHHVNISGLELAGQLCFEYCLWGRVEHVGFTRGGLKIGRGCGNFIVQGIQSDVPAHISGAVSCGKYIPGSKPDVNNIILCDSTFASDGVYLDAAPDCGVLNIQVDHIRAGAAAVTVGSGEELPDQQFFNLTFTDLEAPQKVVYKNEAKHVYEK